MKINALDDSFKAIKSRWFQKSFILQSGVFLFALCILSLGIRQSLRFYLIKTTADYGLRQIETIQEIPHFLEVCEAKKWEQIDPSLEISLRHRLKTIFCKEINTYGPHLEYLQHKDWSYSLKRNIQNQLYIYVQKKIETSRACDDCVIQIGLPIEKYQPLLLDLDQILIGFSFGIYLIVLTLSLWGGINIIRPLTLILAKITKLKNMHAKALAQSDFSANENKEQIDEWNWASKSLDELHLEMEKTFGQMALENKKMSALLESLSDSIVALDKEEKIIFANGQFRQNFIPYDLKNFNMSEFKILKIINNPSVVEIFQNAMSSGQIKRKSNLELSARGGLEKKIYDLSINPIKDSSENILGSVCIFHDVTERRLAEQMREDFVSNVSHEIRTPLTAMKGYAQMLSEAKNQIPEEFQALLSRIESNSDRLNVLFQDILALSMIESNPQITRERVDFGELTEQVLANLKHIYVNKKITIEAKYEVTEGLAGPGPLEQILTNLVTNAYKYTPEKGNIQIIWKKYVPSNEEEAIAPSWFLLQVKDSGIGIEASHIPRLFERFYRVDHSRSREMGGTGLGLAIVKHIAQNHLGKVSVESIPGVGSTFSIYIPNIE